MSQQHPILRSSPSAVCPFPVARPSVPFTSRISKLIRFLNLLIRNAPARARLRRPPPTACSWQSAGLVYIRCKPLLSPPLRISGSLVSLFQPMATSLSQNPYLTDLSLTNLGQISFPFPLYNSPVYNPPVLSVLPRPRLNASGSLYYLPYPNYFEIVDVQHALLRCASPSHRQFKTWPHR